MPLNSRQWLKTAGLATGFFSAASVTATIPSFHVVLEKSEWNHLPPGLKVKLSSNENPYGPSPAVRETMNKAFDKVCRYPWAERNEITEKIAKKEGVSTEHVLVTVGSTEGLKITRDLRLCSLFQPAKRRLYFPGFQCEFRWWHSPTFSFRKKSNC